MTGTLVVAVTCVAILALAWALQRSLIYFPLGVVPSPSEVGLADVESVTFDTDDGIRLHGWFVKAGHRRRSPSPCSTATAATARIVPTWRARLREGVAVLLFDYRGFGGNDGRPTESGLAATRAPPGHT